MKYPEGLEGSRAPIQVIRAFAVWADLRPRPRVHGGASAVAGVRYL